MDFLSFCHVQFQKEARDTQDLLKRLDTEINQKYNPDFKDQYQLEGLLTDMNVNTVITTLLFIILFIILLVLHSMCLWTSKQV